MSTKDRRDGAVQSRHWHLWAAGAALLAVVVAVASILVFSPSLLDLGDNSSSATAAAKYRRTFDDVTGPGDLRLLGFPATGSISIAVPVDADPRNLEVHLEGESQRSVEGQFTLTVFARGRAVKQQALPLGDSTIAMSIRLDPTAIVNGRVRLAFTVEGTPTQARCSYEDRGNGSLVIMRGTSSVNADLGRAIATVRDRVASLHHAVTLYLPKDLATQEQGAAWYRTAQNLGLALTQAGYVVSFADLPASELRVDGDSAILIGSDTALEKAGWRAPSGVSVASRSMVVGKGSHGGPTLAIRQPTADVGAYLTNVAAVTGDSATSAAQDVALSGMGRQSVTLATLGLNTAPVQVSESQTWSMNYSLTDMPQGRAPREFRADISTPAGATGWRWMVTVTLNNKLLYAEPIANGLHKVVAVPLSVADQRLNNALSLTVQRDGNLGGCDRRVTPYTVQLGPDSGFVVGEGSPVNQLISAPEHLHATRLVVLQPAAAEDAVEALTATVPTLAAVLPVGVAPKVKITNTVPAGKNAVLIAVGDVEGAPVTLQRAIPPAYASLVGRMLGVGGPQDGVVTMPIMRGDAYLLVLAFNGLVTNQGTIDYGSEEAQVASSSGSTFVLGPHGTIVRSVIAHAAVGG